MKTIQLISDCIERMTVINLPATIEIGSFKVTSKGHLHNWAGTKGEYAGSTISFNIEFRPDHIQHLLDIGVNINFDSVVMANLSSKALRFKNGREAIKQGRYAPYYYMGNPENRQTGVIENWLIASANCSLSTLKTLDRYCRDNHRDQISIDNDHNLVAAGWKKKEKYATGISILSKNVAKNIRRNVANKKKNLDNLLPIEKRALAQKKYE